MGTHSSSFECLSHRCSGFPGRGISLGDLPSLFISPLPDSSVGFVLFSGSPIWSQSAAGFGPSGDQSHIDGFRSHAHGRCTSCGIVGMRPCFVRAGHRSGRPRFPVRIRGTDYGSVFLRLSRSGVTSSVRVLCSHPKAAGRARTSGFIRAGYSDGGMAIQRVRTSRRQLRLNDVRIYRSSWLVAGSNKGQNHYRHFDVSRRHNSPLPVHLLENGTMVERCLDMGSAGNRPGSFVWEARGLYTARRSVFHWLLRRRHGSRRVDCRPRI